MKHRAPVAKLAAALILPVMLLFSLNPLVPAIALAAELACVPLFGLSYRSLLRKAAPLWLSAAAMLVIYTVFGTARGGETLLALGPFTVTTETLATGGALALRLLAVALPAVVVFATTDPTDLADSLIQHARVSPRFAIGALAAFRLVGMLRDDWAMITMARRARGVRPGFARIAFVLLVGAIRRGVRLSIAMDARGFDSRTPRTVARPQSFTMADAMLVVGAIVLGALALWLGTK
ncbi:energy-coupling factor transporter transmembrane component T family protein [Allorhizocola rhizosphaerae]|uniref:energy-coupling factor transporter transmembrane component T family protein n=1 Tax=Allorhizocola rhizosphaerae TaxID=1872709 RepID=UPI002483055E|nr:energy-coupling factor transporter transmembrane component T [Allorhizocola rhizosphaerae]